MIIDKNHFVINYKLIGNYKYSHMVLRIWSKTHENHGIFKNVVHNIELMWFVEFQIRSNRAYIELDLSSWSRNVINEFFTYIR